MKMFCRMPWQQWLRFCASSVGAQVCSLVAELRFHMPWGVAKKFKKWKKKKGLKLDTVIAVELNEYTKIYWILHYL